MHLLLYLLMLIFLVLLALGVYLTVVAYKKDQTNANKWVTDHLKTLKWVGPMAIAFGFLGSALMLNMVVRGDGLGDSVPTTKFGFRFF